MDERPNLEKIFEVATDKVDLRKLELLKRKLENALGKPLASQIVDDPTIIRCLLVENLREEGVSPGTIQSLEQLFMGIIRRAAIKGLLPAPPEGPWTYPWQIVLDAATKMQGAKSAIRSLASWATARGIAPNNIVADHLSQWVKDTMIHEKALDIAEQVLAQWPHASDDSNPLHSSYLLERLQKKALKGTVKYPS